jgi:hypothetical protein
MIRQQLFKLLLGAVLVAPVAASADTTKVDGYTIHHNAFTTDTLAPEVAKSYGIQRSKFRGVLVVTVLKDAPGTEGTSVPARIETKSVLLTGQAVRMPMREIHEQKANYYITEFPIHNEETKDFLIEVTPQGAHQTFKAKMTQQFFTD